MNISAKTRQLLYWQQEVDRYLSEWKSCIANGDKNGAEVAKERYLSARAVLDEFERRKAEVEE